MPTVSARRSWGQTTSAALTQQAPMQAALSIPAPPLWNPQIGTERVFAPNQSISQTRKLRVSSRFTPLLGGLGGQSRNLSTPGRRPRQENASFLCCWTELNPAPQRPRKSTAHPHLPHTLPLPAGSQNPAQGRGQKQGAAGRTLRGSAPLAALVLLLQEEEGVGHLCSKDATQATFPDCECGDSP